MSRPPTARKFYVARWICGGAMFGAALMLVAWRVAAASDGSLTFAELHAAHPTMAIIDLLPTILGAAGGAIGILHLRLTEARRRTEETARQIAAGWTADLHAANAELAENLDERQRFYAALSHEMRTPLSSIVGYAELADGIELDPPEISEYVANIYGSARVLLEMVNDLLDAARLELGGVTVHLDAVDGNAIAEEVIGRLLPLAAQKQLDIQPRLEVTAPVLADAGRLQQILTNLIANAIKYSDRGTIYVRSGRAGDGRIYFAVEDEGAGLDPEDLERIFLPFEQAGEGLGRRDSTGLGLTISRMFAAAMDGEVTATSEGRNQGSEFRVLLHQADERAGETRTATLTVA